MAEKTLKATEISKATPKQMREAITEVFEQNRQLTERLNQVQAMFAIEDRNWFNLSRFNDDKGMSLEELNDWSEQIREAIVGNPHIKRGIRLRANSIWDGGIHYGPLKSESRGRGANVKARVENPINQRNFYGHAAREERESALYSEGIVTYIGDPADYTVEALPIWEVGADWRNPDNAAEIWAYRRDWSQAYVEDGTVHTRPKKVWYYTDTFESKRGEFIPPLKEGEEIEPSKIIFDGMVNTQTGWAYGAPDALSALIWARLYRDFLVNGKIMSDALAQFAFQAMPQNQASQAKTAAKLAEPQGAGGTVVSPNALVPMSSAGKGYDFSSGNALAAVVATAIEVSMIHLTSDPGTAGASYGSAGTLDLPTKLAVKSRRQWHIDFDKRVLRWMGQEDPKVWFDSLNEATDIFRQMQAIVLKWSTGLYSAKEIKDELEQIAGRVASTPVAGVIVPNNEKALLAAAAASTNVTPTPSGQGQSSPAGKGQNANDLRTDSIGEMKALLERFGAMIDDIEKEQAA